MKNIREFFEPEVFNTYDEERNIIGIIKILYDNVKEKNELNFIEAFIKDPERTLERFYKIIEKDQKFINRKINEKRAKNISLKKGMRFVINMDKLGKQRDEDNIEALEKNYSSLIDMLFEIYKRQIQNIEIENLEVLYNTLYQIESVGYHDTEFKEDDFYKIVLENAKKNMPGINLETIINNLPNKVKDTPKELESTCDDRYNYIKKQLSKIKSIEENKLGLEQADN